MYPHFTIAGVVLFTAFVFIVKVIILLRTVATVKVHMRQLNIWYEEAVQKGDCEVHYKKAHEQLYRIQEYKLVQIKKSIVGSLFVRLLGKSWYEITPQRPINS